MDKKQFERHKAYFDKVTPVLIQAEQTIREIKDSEEWKRAFNYFHVLYKRGELKTNPNHTNGYKIELRGQSIELSDLVGIVSPEQLEQIKQKAF